MDIDSRGINTNKLRLGLSTDIILYLIIEFNKNEPFQIDILDSNILVFALPV